MTSVQSVPRVPYLYLMSRMLHFAEDPLRAMEAITRQKKFADLFQIDLQIQKLNWIAHPDYADYILHQYPLLYTRDNMFNQTVRNLFGNNLAVSDGDVWERRRWFAGPQFTSEAANSYFDVMIDTTQQELDNRWAPNAGKSPIPVLTEVLHLTNRVMSRLMFGPDVPRDVSDAIGNGLEIREGYTGRFLALSFLPEEVVPGYRAFHKADKQINDAFKQQIVQHRSMGESAPGILGKLIRKQDANGRGLTDEAIRVELGGMFVGGRDAIGAATGWTLYLLDQHPEMARVVQDELTSVLDGKPPTLKSLQTLKHLHNAVNEALRLYPAVWFAAPRTNQMDDIMLGYKVEKGSLNFVNLFLMHRNPSIWEDGDRFIPSRFESLTDLQQRAFRPFAYMPHQCLGAHVAALEVALVCAMILQRFRIETITPYPMDNIPYDLRTTVRPGNPIPAHIYRL